MARRRSKNYKQVFTETVNLGISGDQIHIAEVTKLDPALRGAFLNNIQYNVMAQGLSGSTQIERSALPAFTMYLSYQDAGGWSDDAVITASATAQGGGNGNLSAKRRIMTDQTGSTVAEQLGPVHLWMEATDVPVQPDTELECRLTFTVWGRMIKVNVS